MQAILGCPSYSFTVAVSGGRFRVLERSTIGFPCRGFLIEDLLILSCELGEDRKSFGDGSARKNTIRVFTTDAFQKEHLGSVVVSMDLVHTAVFVLEEALGAVLTVVLLHEVPAALGLKFVSIVLDGGHGKFSLAVRVRALGLELAVALSVCVHTKLVPKVNVGIALSR